ncbi:MAG: T9SS type A sorting domain-containing protein [Bacteroidota bacterium]
MKHILLSVLLLSGVTLWSQIPSDCTINSALKEAYDRDIKGLAIKRMQATNSPELSSIEISEMIQDSILEGMAAIFNLSGTLAEADSVFNLYCVHDNAFTPAVYGFILGVDTESPIAQAWEAGNTLTGNTILDNLLTIYNFELENYISFGAGVLYTDQYLNLFALADSITASVPGIEYGEPDYIIGGAGVINYNADQNGNRLYEFRYQWNDCFDGCDNFYSWYFTVTPNCEVIFTGTDEGGFFGIEELPSPTNCQLTTSTRSPIVWTDFALYPNPTTNTLSWKASSTEGHWHIYNAQGVLVQKGNWSINSLDVSNFPNGMYWLCSYEPNGQLTGRKAWIKQ